MRLHAFAAALLLLAASGHAQSLSGEVGSTTFRELGFGNVTLTAGNESRVLRFDLPQNVSQGPGRWYVIHLDLLTKFNESALREAPGAPAYVSGSTNGRAFASVKFNGREVNGSLGVLWDFVNVTGVFRDITAPGEVRLRLSNYPQVQGVRPGSNEMELRLEDPAHLVERAVIGEDSAIEVTGRSPPKLRFARVESLEGEVQAGVTFALAAVLRNEGGLPVKGTQVRVLYPQNLLTLVEGNATTDFEWIEKEAQLRWRFGTLRGGEGVIQLVVQSESTDSSPLARVPVAVSSGDEWGWAVAAAAAGAALGGLALWVRARWKR